MTSHHVKLRMYADDTIVASSTDDSYVLQHKMNRDMELIKSWLTANKLTLNVKKTKYMFIGSQHKLSQIHDNLTLRVDNTPLDRVVKYKFLGFSYMAGVHTLSMQSKRKYQSVLHS